MTAVSPTPPEAWMDVLSTGVLLLDQALRIAGANPAAMEMLGLPGKRAIGDALEIWLPQASEFLALLTSARDQAQGFTLPALSVPLGRDASIETELAITISLQGDSVFQGLLVEMVSLDRHQQIRREDDLTAQHQARRMLMRGLAHEVKNPLGGIRGAAQLLDSELRDREQREFTRIIMAEADRLNNLVDSLLGPDRDLHLLKTNLHQLSEHVLTLLEQEFPRVHFKRDYDPSLPELKVDRDQLIQVLMNILRNACQALEGEGNVHVQSRVERQFTIRKTRHRLVSVIHILDEGPGIPRNLQEMLFYPLVSGRTSGTGLGLAIAQDIVNRHGGLIKFESRPGLTRFSLYLPVTESS